MSDDIYNISVEVKLRNTYASFHLKILNLKVKGLPVKLYLASDKCETVFILKIKRSLLKYKKLFFYKYIFIRYGNTVFV